MRHELITIDGFVVVVFFHGESSNLLLEAKMKGQPLIGTYSTIHHQPHTPDGDYHLHVYDGPNQIFAINKGGSAHDGFNGIRIPNRVYKALSKKFDGWMFPPNQIIESINYIYFLKPVESLTYKELINETEIIHTEISTLSIFENTKGLILENENINLQKDQFQERIKELYSQLYKRIE